MNYLIFLTLISVLSLSSCGRKNSREVETSGHVASENLPLSEVPEKLQEDMPEGTFFRKAEEGLIQKFEPTDLEKEGIIQIMLHYGSTQPTLESKTIQWNENPNNGGYWLFSTENWGETQSDFCLFSVASTDEKEKDLLAALENLELYLVSYFDRFGNQDLPEEVEMDESFQTLSIFYKSGQHHIIDSRNPHLMTSNDQIFDLMQSMEAELRIRAKDSCL